MVGWRRHSSATCPERRHRTIASRFEGAFLSVARGNRLLVPLTPILQREVEVTEVKVEKLRKESETGSDFSNKMTALCLLNIQRQRMLHEEALGLEMKKVLSKHKSEELRVRLVKASGKKYDPVERSIISVTRRCLFILRTTKVKTTSSRFCSSEIKFCSQDLLGISYTPVKSRRLEWSFRRRSNNRYGTQRCCWSSSGSQHQQTENFSEHW
ncbi:hypothetical protein F2Q69_00062914 [Brassica cretica]|uniref:Uncharacterized protein n=1 Tax=Brassica cretica TaxID=69181 RepID=A0A8S9RIQ0_BRACR|nr:hypothetical protein F2Q69_00062914 [Brassica cretica]